MRRLFSIMGLMLAMGLMCFVAACGGGSSSGSQSGNTNKTTPSVTVTPTPASATTVQSISVSITVAGSGSTPTGTVTLSSGAYTSTATALSSGAATITIPASTLAAGSDSLVATYTPDSGSSSTYQSATGGANVTISKVSPTVTLTPASASVAAAQSLQVGIVVSGGGATPTGTVTLTSGSYSSSSVSLSSGAASITIPAGTLTAGTPILSVSYTPDSASSGIYQSSTGSTTETVSQYLTPSVTVTPASNPISASSAVNVTVAVNGGTNASTPTGSVILSAGSYASSATGLSSGSATITIPASTFTTGSYTLSAAYTPDTASAADFKPSTGTATLLVASTVSVNQTPTTTAVTSRILGMNMATWYDIETNTAAIQNAFKTAGITAVRWPGGSWSDIYHWESASGNAAAPFNCSASSNGSPNSNDTFANFLTYVVKPTNVSIALTADYGSDPTCTTGGLPSEAASWVTAAKAAGYNVDYMTVGNENYGSWEEDLHTLKNDPGTYAAAVNGSDGKGGFYSSIKAANSNTRVGIVVDADNKSTGWDATVMANAKGSYDFVELHFYPQSPGSETDANLLHNSTYDAQALTTNLKILKNELATYGTAGTPIYVGELGSVYTEPGKQSMSITQSLFAGEVLGEMMNFGVARASWWIGFGGCSDQGTSGAGNFSSSLYGWQNYGGYMVFADGSCTDAPAVGTLLPTARAFQLFSQVAVDGEYVLTPTVAGDTTDVLAYAATHNAGAATALVLFNLNETTSEPVTVSLSKQSTSSDVTLSTYSRALYDQSDATTPVWAAPTSTDLGAQTLPLTVTLAPWSMNVLIIK